MSRSCIVCGKLHNMCFEDRAGNIFEELDKCYDCIFAGCEMKFDPHLDLSSFGTEEAK